MVRLHVTTTYMSSQGAALHTQVLEFEDNHTMEMAKKNLEDQSEKNSEGTVWGTRYECVVIPGGVR